MASVILHSVSARWAEPEVHSPATGFGAAGRARARSSDGGGGDGCRSSYYRYSSISRGPLGPRRLGALPAARAAFSIALLLFVAAARVGPSAAAGCGTPGTWSAGPTDYYAHLPFDGNISDVSGALPAGSNVGGVGFSSSICHTGTQALGPLNNYDGSSGATQYLEYDSVTTTLPFSVSEWVYTWADSPTNAYQFSFSVGSNANWGMNMGFTNLLYPYSEIQTPTYTSANSPNVFPVNQWVHLVTTYAPSGLINLYVNGVVATSGAAISGTAPAYNGILAVGVLVGNSTGAGSQVGPGLCHSPCVCRSCAHVCVFVFVCVLCVYVRACV